MNETILEAIDRKEKGSKIRKEGFIPGILYGSALKGDKLVKFNASKLEMDLKRSTSKKIHVKIGEDIKLGFVKEIQRDPISEKIIHIDIQIANATDYVKIKFPVNFEGISKLESNGLLVQIYTPEITVYGEEKDIPEQIIIDVSDKKAGDTIIASMILLQNGVKLVGDPTEVLASIIEPKLTPIEEPEAVEQSAALGSAVVQPTTEA